MTMRAHTFVTQFFSVLVIFSFIGCENQTAAPPPSVLMDTSICLGSTSDSVAPNSSCRRQISTRVVSQGSDPTGCFIVETGDQRRVIPTLWIDDRVEIGAGRDNLALESGTQLTVSFFAFSSADQAEQCRTITASSNCADLESCLVKLGPQTQLPVDGQETVFNFSQAQEGCILEASSSVSAQPEVCDGYDNDCDDMVDESDPFSGDLCERSDDADCVSLGIKTCIDGGQVCQAQPQQDRCNQVDDDCDGEIDEDEVCPNCELDSDCPSGRYCFDSNCVDCLEDNNCLASQPICRDNQCRLCQDSSECGEDRVCYQAGGRCGQCAPDVTDTEQCPLGQLCDPMSLTCQTCNRDDIPCPQGLLCVNGVCSSCDPSNTSGQSCAPGLICGDDRMEGMGYRCRQCDPNSVQDECPDGLVCIGANANSSAGTCERCSPSQAVGNNGCLASSPICILDAASGNVACQPCNERSQCGADADCVGGRCEGCIPPEQRNGAPSSCQQTAPICLSNGSVYRCQSCTTDPQCDTEFFGDAQRDICINGECLDCDSNRMNESGCQTDSTKPICDVNSCRGCANDGECQALNLDGGRRYCNNAGGDAGRCVSCIPNTSEGCGKQRCSTNFECESCDSGADSYCESLFPDAPVCVGDYCESCDPTTTIGRNGCTADEPICSGQPPSCRGCSSNTECGELECSNGRCAPCTTNRYDTETPSANSLDVAYHGGCQSSRPICDGERCLACSSNSDCPLGECIVFGAFNTPVCRLANASLCQSRGLVFDAARRACRSCENNNECTGNTACRPTGSIDENGTTIRKCNGCASDEVCGGTDSALDFPFCNTVDPSGNRDEATISPWVCRVCFDELNDCGINEFGKQTYCTDQGNCAVCIDSEQGDAVDIGCTDDQPSCNGTNCQ